MTCANDLLFLSQLAGIEQAAKEAGFKILTPLVSLDTPGKATVEVVILADPVSRCFCQILIHRLVHFCEHRMVMRFVSWAMKRFANSPRLTLQQTS